MNAVSPPSLYASIAELATRIGDLENQKDQANAADNITKLAHIEPLLAAAYMERNEAVFAEQQALKELELHQLARFLQIDTKPRAVKWVIPGVAEHGVLTISGARGVGKTTCILPLAMAAAGLHAPDYPLAPKAGRWRHVIYIVEHAEQAQRIIAGIVGHGGLGIRTEDVIERLHLVEAKRMDPLALVQVGKLYRAKFTRVVDGVEIPPLVVFDTKAAVLAMENENDNSEASRAIALLKQEFAGLPCWIVGHIAKANFGRTDISALSDRGAGSFEADTIQNIYLVEEKGTRYLVLGKKRFETKTPELVIESSTAEVDALDEWGDVEKTILRWGVPKPAHQTRAEAREDAQAEAAQTRLVEARTAALDAVDSAYRSGERIGRTAAALATGVQKAHGLDIVAQLIEEDWLYEVDIPPKERANNKKAAFLVRLTDQERAALRATGAPPVEKTAIPQAWRKPIPLVPTKTDNNAKTTKKVAG